MMSDRLQPLSLNSSVNKPNSVLVAEIGTVATRVTLLDVVEGESRLVNQVEVPTTIEAPYEDASVAILEGAAQIGEAIGRQLLHDGQLLMPQNHERDGIDHVVSVTSAAGNLTFVITAIASDVSARSAVHACHSTYTSILQIVTLDDTLDSATTTSNVSWIVRQIQAMLSLEPDAVFIAGGLEGGAAEALSRLAHIVGLTALRVSVDASGQQRQDITARPVIYAGNSAARERVVEALSDRAEMLIVDNVRPTLDHENLEPARRELHRLYDERVLTRLPGLATLRRLSRAPVTTVCHAEGLMTRFVAERYQRHVLTLDIGSSSSSAFLAWPEHYHLAVLGACGTGYGLTTVLNERGIANIARWLPFEIDEPDLLHWLLNKQLRPHLVPTSREDMLIEQAVAREALTLVIDALSDEVPNFRYDFVIAGGGVLARAAHPGLAVLSLLDVLQPTAEQTSLAVDLYLDALALMPACGALAHLDPDAAVTVIDRDMLRNVPLATCVVALGEGQAGAVAVEAELTTRTDTRRIEVRHGQIVRLPLEQGLRGKLTLRPASGIRVGQNAPGEEVSSDVAAISGSALGVVIDARGRPLRLPVGDQQRRERLWEWLVALGVEDGPSPYVAVEPTETIYELSSAEPVVVDPPLADEQFGEEPVLSLPESTLTDERAPAPTRGAEPEPHYAGFAEAPPSAEQDATPQAKPGSRISLSDLALQESEQSPADSPQETEELTDMDRELAKLRQSVVEEPKRRGLFGRRK